MNQRNSEYKLISECSEKSFINMVLNNSKSRPSLRNDFLNRSIKKSFDYNNKYHIDYIQQRYKGVGNILIIAKLLNYPKNIVFKAIAYLDKIFSNKVPPSTNVDHISSICFLLADKFLNLRKDSKTSNLFEIVKRIPNYKELEILCLKALDYDLSLNSSFDYLISFFQNEKLLKDILTEEEKKICFNLSLKRMEYFIVDMRSVDFSNYVIAATIIRNVLKKKKKSILPFLSYIFEITQKEEIEFIRCGSIMKYIINSMNFNGKFKLKCLN